jgi:hypothetical protein
MGTISIVSRACDIWWKKRFPEWTPRKFNEFRKKPKQEKPKKEKKSDVNYRKDYWESLTPEQKKERMDKVNASRRGPESHLPRWKRTRVKEYKREYMKRKRAEAKLKKTK